MKETMIKEILDAQNGNQVVLNNIVENNVRLVWSIVRKFNNKNVEDEDLFQIGVIGLIKSIKRFDMKYNTKLSTYAAINIIGEIKRYLRDNKFNNYIKSIDEEKDRNRIIDKLESISYEEETINKIILEQELNKLNSRERKLFINRFLNDETQTKTAEKLSISQVQVSRLEKKILEKMRLNIKEKK